jgi:hypothetical protein
MRRVYLCGDCFVDAAKDGATDVGGEIAYGTPCETPAHSRILAATHIAEVPEGVALRVGGGAGGELAPAEPPANVPPTVGPLTEMALRLLSSWSRGDEQKADANAITHAVKAASQLLAETGGK